MEHAVYFFLISVTMCCLSLSFCEGLPKPGIWTMAKQTDKKQTPEYMSIDSLHQRYKRRSCSGVNPPLLCRVLRISGRRGGIYKAGRNNYGRRRIRYHQRHRLLCRLRGRC